MSNLMIGVDENGLGPALGPMIATAVTLKVLEMPTPWHTPMMAEHLGITDSKAIASFKNMKGVESFVLAHLADQSLDSLYLHAESKLQTRCPNAESQAQCFSKNKPPPLFGGETAKGASQLLALKKLGIEIVRVKSHVICANAFNDRIKHKSKFAVDLDLFMDLITDSHCSTGANRAICGMIGGIRHYHEFFGYPSRPIENGKGVSHHQVMTPDPIEVRFEVDADARHVAVSLASMFGKYIRELWVLRQNLFYQDHLPGFNPVSGYHDPKTKAFIQSSASVRNHLNIHRDCFLRKG